MRAQIAIRLALPIAVFSPHAADGHAACAAFRSSGTFTRQQHDGDALDTDTEPFVGQ